MIKKDEIAYLLLRLTLGANIFLHGFSRLIGDHAAFRCLYGQADAQRSLAGILGTLRRRRVAVVRRNCGSVDDPWAVDIGRTNRRQPADAHVKVILLRDWHSTLLWTHL